MSKVFRDRTLLTSANEPLVSIIIDNFNYGRFLGEAINSALAQRYPRTEVIVVDDGSTDNSHQIIASYGSTIHTVFKQNGGQASALNAGFRASRGDVILFLDADDILFPDAVSNVVPHLRTDRVSKVHWPMWLIDSQGQRTGGTRPSEAPPAGDFKRQVLERGPSNVASSPTSGNAWRRSLLERIMPIPEDLRYYRSCADEYLYLLAPVFGQVRTLAEPQGCYRIHSNNIYSSRPFREKLSMELDGYDEQCLALANTLARNGIRADVSAWKGHSWFHRLDRALGIVLVTVPPDKEFVLIDGGTWGLGDNLDGRIVHPFFERGGVDWGAPADDAQALEQLHALEEKGTQFLVIAWSSFWWFDEYPRFFECLKQTAECLHRDEAAIIFNLQTKPDAVCQSSARQLVDEGRRDA